MKVVLLGTAAGGGFPQWNCACRMCTSNATPRSQDSIAVSADGKSWYLLNASPDIRAQILATPALASGPGPRQTPLRGALLTDAELDHTLGLIMLREGSGLRVLAPAAVLGALRQGFPVHDIVGSYGGWDWRPVHSGLVIDGLRVSVYPISDKRPKYAAQSTAQGPWVVAYRIEDPATGGVLVYAPCVAAWPQGFDDLVADASYVLLDGTFYSPDEMSGATRTTATRTTATDAHRTGANGAQRAMGHIPVAGEDGSLALIRQHRTAHPDVRWGYTHLNNTNPVLDPDSSEYQDVRAAGIEIPPDGTELVL